MAAQLSHAFVMRALEPVLREVGTTESRTREGRTYTRVGTDTRSVQPGELFVALVGDHFDAHQFVDEAVKKGAAGLVVREGTPVPSGVAVYFVEDTLWAYRSLGKAWRQEIRRPLLAVAGSVGKTTTKEFLAALLRGKFKKIHKTMGSQNGFVGIPMTLLELREEHDLSVIEVGIDAPGVMEQHIALLEPEGAVLSAIGAEHLETLDDLETVAHEEFVALQRTLDRGGWIAINEDDPWIHRLAEGLNGDRVWRFGESVSSGERSLRGFFQGTRIRLNGAGMDEEVFECPLPGLHNSRNLLGALTLARALGLTAEEMRRGLNHFEVPGARSKLEKWDERLIFFSDYYNANPSSMEAALKTVSELAQAKNCQAWAVLGDMLELGPRELDFHRDLLGPLSAYQFSHLILLGERMKSLFAELKKKGGFEHLVHVDTHRDAAEYLATQCMEPSLVLLKASRGQKFEKILEELKKIRPARSDKSES